MSSENSSNSSKGGGNTDDSSLTANKQPSGAIKWLFVLNNYTDEMEKNLVPILDKYCKVYLWSHEVGESGTPHCQGYMEFHKKIRRTGISKLLENPKIHVGDKDGKPCKGSRESNIAYVTKDGPAVYYKGIPAPVKIISELRPFQQSIVDIIKGPVNEGKVVWIYDETGQLGKTELLRYCFIKYKVPFSYGGKCADIINLVYNNADYMKQSNPPCLFYNFGRATKPREISYKSMEQVSDGCISNTKFEAGCFVCNKPHVVVFANCLPVEEEMTKGRFLIKCINPKDLTLLDYVAIPPVPFVIGFKPN